MKQIRKTAILAGIFLLAIRGVAQVPQQINYQGRVSVGGVPFQGTGQFKFALVRPDTGATTWSHDGSSVDGSQPQTAISLPVTGGHYSLGLGDTTIAGMTVALTPSALQAADVRLRIWFNDGVHGFEALTPDTRLASVPFALFAAGLPDSSVTPAQLGVGTISGLVIGCNNGANAAQVYIPGRNILAFVGSGTGPGGFAYTLERVPVGNHTLAARLPGGTLLTIPIVVAAGTVLNGVNFDFGCGVCGDTIAQTERGEQCDDGNTTNGDGCSATCQTEPAICGNGIVEAGEACDDGNLANGDGCTASCQIELAVCGNGIVEIGESCDDGNLAAGDGCSASCGIESLVETEPNDSTATANTGVSGPGPNRAVIGAITPLGDKDTFRVDLSAGATVHLETFDASGSDCSGGLSTTLRLLNNSGVQIYQTSNSGIGGCAALVVDLPAGTFYAQLEENGNNATVPAYTLAANFPTGSASESEPNNSSNAANTIHGSRLVVAGDRASGVDEDWYALFVPVMTSLRIELFEGDTTETCESNGIDSFLSLYNSAGALLESDDDSGRGFCSAIDGRGASPRHGGAHNLVPGTYFIRVSSSDFATGPAATFKYKLEVLLP